MAAFSEIFRGLLRRAGAAKSPSSSPAVEQQQIMIQLTTANDGLPDLPSPTYPRQESPRSGVLAPPMQESLSHEVILHPPNGALPQVDITHVLNGSPQNG